MKKIPITNKKKEIIGYSKCSDCDFEMLSEYKWVFTSRGYVCTMVRKSDNWRDGYYAIYMHRLVTNCQKGLQVDHINHEETDNRRENLRCVTASENAFNRKIQKTAVKKEKKTGTLGVAFMHRIIGGKKVKVLL